MPPTAVNALRLLILSLAAAAAVALAVQAADRIETRIEDQLAAAMAEAGHDWVTVAADGLTATLGGTAPDEAARFRALTAAGEQISQGNLTDTIEVQAAEPMALPEYRLEVLRSGNTITLHGLVPGGPEGREALVSQVRALPSVTDVSDLLSAAALAPPEGWDPALGLALEMTRRLEDARVTLTPGEVTLSGLAATRAEARVLSDAFRADARAAGVALTMDLRQPRPVVSPFVTRFRIGPEGARFEACTAETVAGRDAMLAAGRRAGATDDAEACIIGLGAPVPRWSAAAVNAIDAAARLSSASVTISDLSVVLVAGDGVEPGLLARIEADLETLLPEAFALSVLAPQSGPGAEGGAAALPPAEIVFSATRSPEGQVVLRGPVGDAQDRDLVDAYAGAMFGAGLHTSLREKKDLPDGWPVRVLAGLEAFSEVETGTLRITPEALDLRGVTGDSRAGQRVTERLGATLGGEGTVTVELTYDESLDPTAALPTPQECIARVNAILATEGIEFGPGATTLDGRALRVVDQIARVLRDCGAAEIEIGGHTDSQGGAEMNARLSQARADAVRDALISRRVRLSGLTATGYGEERPVEDNDSAAGREANRRIEFVLVGAETEADAGADNGTADPDDIADSGDGAGDEIADAADEVPVDGDPGDGDPGNGDATDSGSAAEIGAAAQACVDAVNAILAADKLTFAPGSVQLDATATGIVEGIAEVLRGCPSVDMEIGGHTDSQGSGSMNTRLSQARADAVFNALIGAGLPAARLGARGYGETVPIADNGTADGREANRRIEFTLVTSPVAETGDTGDGGDTDAGTEEQGDGPQ
jgi:OOP family OmpA-OmpF porin